MIMINYFDIFLCSLIILLLLIMLYRKKRFHDITLEKMRYREKHYAALEKHQEEIRMIKHDLKHQLSAAITCLDEEDYQKVKELLCGLTSDVIQSEKKNFTLNPTVNSVLNSKLASIEANNISYNFQVHFPPAVRMSEQDLARLLGNILDNALEAEQRIMEDRFINLLLHYYNNSIIIVCENKVDTKVLSLKTTKSNVRQHGFGMKSIDRIIGKYSGTKQITSTGHCFRLEINLWDM